MADVTLKYKGATIAELSASGNKTIETAGKYCEADILLEYVKSGGAVLPSVISKIDGGSFEYDTDTAIQSSKIQHNLGEKPKGYIIWSDDVMLDGSAYANQTLMFSYGIGLPWVNNGSTNTTGYSYAMWRRTNGTVTEQNISSPTITAAEVAPYGYYYWRGNATYKWLVWA